MHDRFDLAIVGLGLGRTLTMSSLARMLAIRDWFDVDASRAAPHGDASVGTVDVVAARRGYSLPTA